MVKLDNGRFATSDSNEFYRKIIIRNKKLKRLLSVHAQQLLIGLIVTTVSFPEERRRAVCSILFGCHTSRDFFFSMGFFFPFFLLGCPLPRFQGGANLARFACLA